MNTASHFSHSKNFFNFFENPGTFYPYLCRGIYGEKKFFQKPKLNIIDREKIFKPFDRFPVVKFF